MIWLRSLLFNFIYYSWAIITCLLTLWILLLPRRQAFFCIRVWLRSLELIECYIAGIRYEVIGWEHVPSGACIIAAKHQSAWETYKLPLLFKNPAVVLKEEITKVPILGWYGKKTGMIPIDRGGGMRTLIKMKQAAQQAKAEGRKIAIFPQGTRLAPGVQKPYKGGIAVLYEELQLPIVPMALNSGLLWPKNSFVKKSGLITIEFLPPIPAGLSRQEMLQQLQSQLETASDRLCGI